MCICTLKKCSFNFSALLMTFKDGAFFCYAYVLRILGLIGDTQVSLGICPLTERYFCTVYDDVEKVGFSKGYQNPKRKLGVIMHFSEIIELKLRDALAWTLI